MAVADQLGFKEALFNVNKETYALLERDIEIVADYIEKGLMMFFENNAACIE